VNKKSKYSIEVKSSSIIVHFVIIVSVLSNFFDQYFSVIPGITLGELLLIAACIFMLVKKKFKIGINDIRLILMFYISSLLFSLLSLAVSNVSFQMNSEMDVITRWIRYFAYVMMFIILCEDALNVDCFIKLYRLLCILIAGYTILQFVFYILFHIYLPVNILPITNRREITSGWALNYAEQYGFRAYGVFVEPSYLIKFLLPSISFSLLGWRNDKPDWLCFSLASFAIFVSTSAQGIAIWSISLLYFVFVNKMLNKKQALVSFGAIVAFIIVIVIVGRVGVSNYAFQRLESLLAGKTSDRSTLIRVFRGFAFWQQLPFKYKLIGVGMGNIANFADTFNIVTDYDYYYRTAETLEYMNGISTALVCGGLVSFAIFIYTFMNLFKGLNKKGKLIFFQFILIMFSGSSLLSLSGFFYIFILTQCKAMGLEDKGESFYGTT